MFCNNSRFSEKDRRMTRTEFLKGISYYKEEHVKNNKSDSTELIEALPQKIDTNKLQEALSIFELTPK